MGDYLVWWVEHRRIDERTRMSYASHIRVHLIPHLGAVRLAELTIADVDGMFAAIEVRNGQSNAASRTSDPLTKDRIGGMRVISAASVQRIRATLRKALNDAIGKYRLLEYNPAVRVELVRPERPVVREWTDARWRSGGPVGTGRVR